jgi:hypothetical protein
MAELSTVSSRPGVQGWLTGVALGAVTGAVILGAGGRLAMRGVAIVQEWTLSFSVDGSAAVVFMGACAGVAGAIILLSLLSVPRLPRLARAALFWAAAILITLRILQPIDRDRVVMFTPVVLVYGLALQLSLARVVGRRPGPC